MAGHPTEPRTNDMLVKTDVKNRLDMHLPMHVYGCRTLLLRRKRNTFNTPQNNVFSDDDIFCNDMNTEMHSCPPDAGDDVAEHFLQSIVISTLQIPTHLPLLIIRFS